MSVDQRTRTDGPRAPVHAEAFFAALPDLLDAHHAALRAGLAWLAPRPLVVEVDGAAWTLATGGDGGDPHVTVTPGHGEAAAHVRLTREQLADLVDDQATFMAWFSGGTLDQPRGRLEDLLDWGLVLRAALDGRTLHAPGSVPLRDRAGGDLDLGRSFSPADDDPAELRHFLAEAGYLHLRGVFTEAEMAELSADMDRAAPTYAPGDGRSWWARTADGTDRVVRMQGFDHHSPLVTELLADRRFLAIGELPGDGHEAARPGAANRIEALVKPIGVVEGISDVPWHKDCALGRHSYECCGMTVGISVTGADATSGQLRAVAGSHRTLVWPSFVRRGTGLPEVDLPTGTGDVTVHLSCTLHMAQPPVERERRVLYTSFRLPVADPAEAARARARLYEVRERAPVTVSQAPAT
jgi:hypothetical protein